MKTIIFLVLFSLQFHSVAQGYCPNPDNSEDWAAMASSVASCNSYNQNGHSCTGANADHIITFQPETYSQDGALYVQCHRIDCFDDGIYFDGVCVQFSNNAFSTSNAAPNVEKPLCQPGSIIQTTNQVIGEEIPIVGVSFELTYFSNKVVGRLADYTISTNVSEETVRSQVTGYEYVVKNEAGTTVQDLTLPATANQVKTYVWNGLDASSSETWGPVKYSVTITENATDFSPVVTNSAMVGNFKAKKLGLGGWTPSNWHFYDSVGQRLYRGDGSVRTVIPFNDPSGFIRIVEDEGGLAHYFDSTGRIVKTKSGITGADLYTFQYDATSGRLVSITEPFSQITYFNYDGSGNLISIVAPNGKTTTATLDSNGYLATVTNPKSEQFVMQYSAGGLLTSFQKPNGLLSTIAYDSNGNLISDANSSGNSISISKSSNTITSTSALGRVTTNVLTTSGNVNEVQTNPDGGQITHTSYTANNDYTTYPLGDYVNRNYTLDPRFQNQSYISSQTSGYYYGQRNESYSNSASLSNSSDPFSIVTKTKVTTLYSVAGATGSVFTSTYTGSTKTYNNTTSLGRTFKMVIDQYERPTSFQIGNYSETDFTYTNEKLTQISQADRTLSLGYDGTTKLLTSTTDSLGQITGFTYDLAERLTSKIMPDLSVINYSYDSDENLTSVTPNGRPQHVISYLNNGLTSSYRPPNSDCVHDPSTKFTYNLDKQITKVHRPDGREFNLTYDAIKGTLTSISGDFGTVNFQYQNTGALGSVTKNGDTFNFSYTSGALSGQNLYPSGGVSQYYYTSYPNYTFGNVPAYDRVYSASGSSLQINYSYDNDGLLTAAGDLTLTYDSPNGSLQGTAIGQVTDAYTYNSFGEVATYTASYSGSPLYSYQLTYDKLGRITEKVETISGTTNTYDYQYDLSGRLTQVSKNSSVVSTYQYDSNGNRIGGSVGGVTTSASYDDQDKLKTYNTDDYQFSLNGDLSQKTSSLTGQSVSYQYDVLGNLMQVTSSTQTVAYTLDPAMHRFAKKLNGNIVEMYAYDTAGRLRGILNSSGNLIKQFVYGSKFWVPDYFYDETNSHAEYRIISDNLGSPRLVVKVSDGTIVQTMNHDEFGNVIQDTSPGYQPFGFAGGLYDHDTGLVKFRNRDYDAFTGRWLSKDPILFNGGDANLYGYVTNDPINWIDPTGLYHYVGGAHGPLTQDLDKALKCFDKCTGRDTAITSGNDSHPPSDPHSRGEACDIGRNSNPDLTRADANRCFTQCFTGGYGQEENNNGPGTHFHFQIGPGVNGGTGMAPGVQPHGPVRSQ